MSPTRRDVLKAGAGTAAVGALAGCLDVVGLGADDVDVDGYTAFFALWDFAEHVGGDEMSFEEPVGPGRMGHGWSPDADITPEIAATDIFIYLDTAEFSWAQDIAANLERDHADDLTVVDALSGLEPYLIPFDYDGTERMPDADHGHQFDQDDLAFEEFDIWNLDTQDQLGYWHHDHWHGGIPDVLLDGTVTIGIVLEDSDERVVPLGDDEEYQVDAYVSDGDESLVEIEVDGNEVTFHGRELGRVEIDFEFYREGELVYETEGESTTLDVVEEIESDGEFYDPHTWVDPPLVKRMVDNIADELADLDPDSAETFEENAAAYNQRIEAVHEQIEETVENAELDVAVFAGHDSFQYIERRYGFELRTPVGVSPDAAVSQDDIAGLLEVIEENGIDTVLYDPFESSDPGEDVPQMVQSIFENSDVENAEPLTPVEGTTEQWADNDWGWVEQMEEVNIPSLERALNPE